MSKHWQQ